MVIPVYRERFSQTVVHCPFEERQTRFHAANLRAPLIKTPSLALSFEQIIVYTPLRKPKIHQGAVHL